jgi:hypothetical protein
VPEAYEAAAEATRETDRTHYLYLNLMEMRSVLATGALLSRGPAPRVVLGHHLVDALDRAARRNLYRLADMVLREGGELHLEFLARRGNDGYAGRHHVRPRRPDRIQAELARAGATVRKRSILLASGAVSGREGDVVPSRICRMVVSWDR